MSGDVVSLGPLRVAMQRIGRSHWHAPGRLRSWGHAPLHREAGSLLVPCTDAEALWIGAWLEDGDAPAHIRVRDRQHDREGALELPRDYQLTSLAGGDGPAAPISTAPDSAERVFDLSLSVGAERAALTLVLLPPLAWAARSGRPPPAPLAGPPPPPPRLP